LEGIHALSALGEMEEEIGISIKDGKFVKVV